MGPSRLALSHESALLLHHQTGRPRGRSPTAASRQVAFQAALETVAVITILDTSDLVYAYETASRRARTEVVVAERRATHVA